MKNFDLRVLVGGLLILVGGLFMAQNFLNIPNAWGIIWGVLFGIGGAAFLYAFSTDNSQWWALIPGMALLGLMILILGDSLFPRMTNYLGGSIFLGAIALSFWVVYLVNREAWWAVIPAGVLTTLAIVAGIDPFVRDSGWIFLVGLGLTFAVVGILPSPSGRMTWAFIPAGILLVLGLFTSNWMVHYINFIWPVALIVLGGFFIFRTFRS